MRIKPGVRVGNMCPGILLAINVAESVRREIDGKEVTITSLCEGKHSRGSLHYDGKAVDIRTRDCEKPETFAAFLKDALGGLSPDYDVVLEKDHIHVEFQPKFAWSR